MNIFDRWSNGKFYNIPSAQSAPDVYYYLLYTNNFYFFNTSVKSSLICGS